MIGFIIGFFFGGLFGALVMCLAIVARGNIDEQHKRSDQ